MINTLIITSPAFSEGGWIPVRHCGYGEDSSPEIHIEGFCDKTVSLAITFDDMDHPIIPGYSHWLAWNIPTVGVLPEGFPKGERITMPLVACQGIGYGKHQYRGPKPPFNWTHTYLFTVFALDTALDITPKSKRKDLFLAMEGHILQKGTLTGKYQRNKKE